MKGVEVRSDRVIAYRPSDREVENGRTIDRFDIKRGENRSTLEREKIRTPLTLDDGRTISSDRPREREREINVGMDTRRDEGRIREESKREQSADQFKRDAERDRIRIESENRRMEKAERDRAERRKDETVNREATRERQPVYERQRRSKTQLQLNERLNPDVNLLMKDQLLKLIEEMIKGVTEVL